MVGSRELEIDPRWSLWYLRTGAIARHFATPPDPFAFHVGQAEAKTNLRAICVSQKSYYAGRSRFAKTFAEIHFDLPSGFDFYYTYYMGDQVLAPNRAPKSELPRGVETYVKDQSFKAAAVGHIGKNGALDVWTIDETFKLTNVTNGLDH